MIEGRYATLKYERRLAHPREVVWKAITDPRELALWFNNKSVINGRNGGTIDFVTGPAGFHTTGRILVWDPSRVFEHEWHTAPHPQLPKGEAEAVIRWELVRDGDSTTILTLTFSRLTKPTALGLLPECMPFLIALKPTLKETLCQIGCCDMMQSSRSILPSMQNDFITVSTGFLLHPSRHDTIYSDSSRMM